MAQRVDFASEAFFRDPTDTVAKLRSIGPAVETWFPIVGKVWVTTTHEATAQMLKDSATFSCARKGAGLRGSAGGCRSWCRRSRATC